MSHFFKNNLFYYYRLIKYRKKIKDKQVSYFPELTRKKEKQIRKDKRYWIKKYKEFNDFHYLYGLDIVDNSIDSFLDNNSFMSSRNEMALKRKDDSQISLLRDKFLFYKYMSASGISVPRVFGFCCNGINYDENMLPTGDNFISDKGIFFLKEIDGECASFVKCIHNKEEYDYFLKSKKNGSYIMQESVIQNSIMSTINPFAINTLRIVTVYNGGTPFVLSYLLRVGTKKSMPVDNWAAGGLAIGIQKNGYLKKYGFFKPKYGTKTDRHPDTNIVFQDFKIPFFQDSLDLAIRAHRFFYNIETIGWDIAITPNGPTIIEANDNWAISLMQACDRPLKEEWNILYNNWQTAKKKMCTK